MYLVDTSIWLKRLLDQDRSDEVKTYLDQIDSSSLAISDFAYHSIGVILTHLEKTKAYVQFTSDLFDEGAVTLYHLTPGKTPLLIEAIEQYSLDFDDAYQYVVANQEDAKLVTFDRDFQRTDRNSLHPLEAVQT